MKIKADNYTIGDLAKFYGVSTDTIRLYDKKGVLLSQKNDENNYRIYSRDDMIMMDYIVKLRMLEIPLTDIRKITGDFSIAETREYCLHKIEKIEEELERLSGLKAKTEKLVTSVEAIETHLDKITVCESPVFILRDIEEGIAVTNELFDALQLDTIPMLTVYGSNAFAPETMKMASQAETRASVADYYISQEDDRGITKRADFPHDQFTILPSKLGIHTIIKALPEQEYHFHYRIKEYAKAHCFKLTGENLNRTLLAKSKGVYCADYYECWYFIEED